MKGKALSGANLPHHPVFRTDRGTASCEQNTSIVTFCSRLSVHLHEMRFKASLGYSNQAPNICVCADDWSVCCPTNVAGSACGAEGCAAHSVSFPGTLAGQICQAIPEYGFNSSPLLIHYYEIPATLHWCHNRSGKAWIKNRSSCSMDVKWEEESCVKAVSHCAQYVPVTDNFPSLKPAVPSRRHKDSWFSRIQTC